MDYYRFAKSEIWAHEREKASADEARERYEFRQLREAREQQEKAARLAAKTAASRAALLANMAENNPVSNATLVSENTSGATTPAKPAAPTPAELIAAALARARAQATEAKNTTHLSTAQQAEIDAIEARRAEIRTQAQPHFPPDD